MQSKSTPRFFPSLLSLIVVLHIGHGVPFNEYTLEMKILRTKHCPKLVTITAERLSDSSRITFTIPCDKKIKDLRSLLNHHLPPCLPDKFDLYSFQRGAQIHYHPPSFRLDYFPVIFDQSVLSLKMDDRIVNIPRNENTISTPQRCLTLLKSHFRRFSRTLRQFVHSQNTTVEKKSVIFSVS